MTPIFGPDFTATLLALAVGLLIGLERGWHSRDEHGGLRVAGLRTFGLICLLGCLLGLASAHGFSWLPGAGFIALAVLLIYGYGRSANARGDFGITTIVAALITFLLGVLISQALFFEAVSAGVLTAIILGSKKQWHGFIRKLERRDLVALLRFLFLSAVILPILPNRSIDPLGVINPFQFWLMVVLISGIGFVGYATTRLLGPRFGLLSTAFAGSLVSSTAVTLSFSHLARSRGKLQPILAGGIMIAATVMIVRVLVVVAVLSPVTVPYLAGPVVLMIVGGAAWAWMLMRRLRGHRFPVEHQPNNPLDIKTALFFAAVLIVVSLIGHFAFELGGDMGIYGLSLVVGLADVDALILSVSRMVAGNGPSILTPQVGATAILITTAINTIVKAVIAQGVAGQQLGRIVMAGTATIIALGLAGFLVQAAILAA